VNVNLAGFASFRPLTAVAAVLTVTVYVVANGNGLFGSGVKISVVVPDQRYVPAIADPL
jgi:hypothetical protein